MRYRHKLVDLRTGLKAQVHAVMAKEGVLPALGEMFGPGGNAQLDAMDLAEPYTIRVESLRDLIAVYDREVAMLDRDIHRRLKGDPGYEAIQVIPGVGRVLGAIFVVEIGDVTRFKGPDALSLVGRARPPTPRVGHQGRARSDHQDGIEAGALGRYRGRLGTYAVAPSSEKTSTRSLSAGANTKPVPRWLANFSPRLLRPARQRDSLPGRRGVT